MGNYFKDKKFRLIFLDVEGGIPISVIPRVIFDDQTEKSLVIAARGGPMDFNSYLSPGWKMEVKYSSDEQPKKVDFKDIYDHVCTLKEEEKKNFLKINSNVADEILERMRGLESGTISRLLVLAEEDEQTVEKPIGAEILCFKVKEGGPELVIEFLLSAFSRRDDWEWVRRDDPLQRYSPPDDFSFRLGGMTDEEKTAHKQIPIYDFSINSNLDDLIEYEEEFDDDADHFYRSSGYFYYYSVNLKALAKLKEMIHIPWRVQEVLTPDQVAKLDAEVPSILMSELDYIARSVLKQKVDSYVNDRARQYERMRAQQWASDMHDVLGGDGEGNVYMGEGLSLTPDGRLVDD